MLESLTSAQKLVVALVVAALVVAVWLGPGVGRREAAPDAGDVVTYTLPTAADVPITVHVVGEVRRPGLYTLPAGSRVAQAITLAGGFSERARPDSVNLAAFLEDGQQLRVEAAAEAEPAPEPTLPATPAVAAPATAARPQPAPQPVRRTTVPARRTSPTVAAAAPRRSDLPDFAQTRPPAPVRLNSAGLEELQRIDGIGPELAKNILSYRSMHGPFRSLNDLDEVPGIGPATIEKIRVGATLN